MTSQHPQYRFKQIANISIHFVACLYVLATPLLFMHHNEELNWAHFCRGLSLPLSTGIIFYANYFWLVPNLITRRRVKWFVSYNLLLFIVLIMGREWYMAYNPPPIPHLHMPDGGMYTPHFDVPHFNPRMIFRSCISIVFSAGLAVAVRLSVQWREAEEKRKEAELGRTAAELQNLKNQISPHFLLNTLNNIYALTAINSEKAQEAILSLSRMLRYLLYENQSSTVPLSKEAEFLSTYIKLMQLRVARDVDIRYDVDIPREEDPQVAPLIFISLVENAFKHGISPTGSCFIHIRLTVDSDNGLLTFSVSNSNHPKSRNDRSGSGIGLQQVSRRLSLFYPDKHTWEYGPSSDGSRYSSTIHIKYGSGIFSPEQQLLNS